MFANTQEEKKSLVASSLGDLLLLNKEERRGCVNTHDLISTVKSVFLINFCADSVF